MGSTHPYYGRSMPAPQNLGDFASDTTHIDLTNAHMPAYPSGPVDLSKFNELFDARAAAAVSDATGFFTRISTLRDLLEWKEYGLEAPAISIPTFRCLAAMAFRDYFPSVNSDSLRRMVSNAILIARPGWCGTFGPGVDAATDLSGGFYNGDYDMSQMHLLPIVYRYYDELSPDAREYLITALLARGRIHRPRLDDTFTSGGTPSDYSRAGFVSPSGRHNRIGETENHILMILTARYLTNQLLYQRDHCPIHDNRRNGTEEIFGKPVRFGPDCTGLLLTLLSHMLRNDFSEYNAKPYQTQTRSALLNLCSYAYDHEVRLAARMALDYISAHIAVSSSDLRRMVPFRRRNEGKNVKRLDGGFMDVGLLEWFLGADPLAAPFAIQAGNTRAYEPPSPDRHWPWSIASDGREATMEALSDYRLPPSIHDLFANDLHRRFFQRLHRVVQPDVEVTGRNCDNMEIYAGSPSYLITAGGSPATWAIDPKDQLLFEESNQQLGVAVTTSFMPTGLSAGPGTQNRAKDLIQFSSFSEQLEATKYSNYGVAPDFACGHQVHLPGWVVESTLMQAVRRLRDVGKLPITETVSVRDLADRFPPFPPGSVGSVLYQMREIMASHLEFDGQFYFVNRGSFVPGNTEPAGFYLAIYRDRGLALLEAFDTWLHPELAFEEFKASVKERNPSLSIQNNHLFHYRTQNGNLLSCKIWKGVEVEVEVDGEAETALAYGAQILAIQYGDGDPNDTLVEAGNITDKFLSGTVMNSPADAVVEITNPYLGTKITLDMSDPLHPRRTSETGEVEESGSNQEVWVDFAWAGPSEGDFFRPFNSISAAAAALADGGVIRIMPGSTSERPLLVNSKRMTLVAPIGGVEIGVR